MTLSLTKAHWSDLRKHGEETFPHECCGVLLGNFEEDGSKVVQATVRCANQRSDSPHNRYVIDPRELVRVQRQARERDQEIVGFYHSHPQHPARWSKTDLEEAYWTGCSYVITSVVDGHAAETNAFNLGGEDDSKRFEDEEIRVE
jgi:proteasome lid subunit RPN8/RPN11